MKRILLLFVLLTLASCGDDENIPPQPETCTDPTNPLTQNIGVTSATLIWDATNDTTWKIEYGVSGFTQGNGTIVTVATNSTNVENLLENTTYDAYIQATCTDGSVSNWVSFPSFTTLLECLMPTNIQITTTQNTTPTITWDTANFSEEVEIEYGETGFTQGNGTIVSETTNTITIQNLIENTTYDFYLRTKCIDGSFSEWTTVNTFTTSLICSAPTNIQITSDIQNTNATVAWDVANFSEEVEIEYGTTGFIQGSGTMLSTIANSIVLQNLLLYTTYDVYLRTRCSNGNFSAWTSVNTFTFSNCTGNFNGSLTLFTQNDVDNFNYSSITGVLGIGDPNGAPSDIHDLSPLNCLLEVNVLYINNNPNLQTLSGLENLNLIKFGLFVRDNNSLLNIDALSNVTTIGDYNDYWEDGRIIFVIENNASLTHVNLPNLLSAKSARISDCPSLTSIEMPLTTFFFTLRINDNPQINNLNFQNLERLGYVGTGGINFGAFVISDTQLTNLNTFNNLTSSTAGVGISNNPLLQSLNGLSNCRIGGEYASLGVINNDLITDLSGITFSNLTHAYVSILNNDSLLNIDALSSLTGIYNVNILNNSSLTNLDGLGNLNNCILGNLNVEDNSSLTDLCGPAVFITNMNPSNCNFSISNNQYNPTLQDLINGNCSQ